jgi:hypothetical protein
VDNLNIVATALDLFARAGDVFRAMSPAIVVTVAAAIVAASPTVIIPAVVIVAARSRAVTAAEPLRLEPLPL